jgi:hypothetical protein
MTLTSGGGGGNGRVDYDSQYGDTGGGGIVLLPSQLLTL